jgi:hypothetical protein
MSDARTTHQRVSDKEANEAEETEGNRGSREKGIK